MRSRKHFAIITFILLLILILPASATIIPVTSRLETIVKGDTVTFFGSGSTNGTIAIWVMGLDYLLVKTVQPDRNGNFTFVIKPEETRSYSSGQYAFLIQDPGPNGAIEIEPLVWDEGIKIANRGKIVTDIGKKENLPAIIGPKVDAIIKAAERPGIDDIITPYIFYVEGPSIHFDRMSGGASQSRLPNQTTGEKIEITGTTNMGVDNQLHVEIRNLSSRTLIVSGKIPVVEGAILNRWSYILEDPGLPTGDYYITIGRLNGIPSETRTALLTVDGQHSLPSQTRGEIPGITQDYGLLLPIIISIGALGIIGVIIIASMKS